MVEFNHMTWSEHLVECPSVLGHLVVCRSTHNKFGLKHLKMHQRIRMYNFVLANQKLKRNNFDNDGRCLVLIRSVTVWTHFFDVGRDPYRLPHF